MVRKSAKTVERKSAKTVDTPVEDVVQEKKEAKRQKPSELSPSNQSPSKKRRNFIPKFKQRRVGVKDPEPGMFYRLCNDEDGNIAQCRLSGYEPHYGKTEDDLRGTYSGNQMGVLAEQDCGQGVKAIWMKIPMEEWQEIQRQKLKETDFVDKQIEMTYQNLGMKDMNGVKKNVYKVFHDDDDDSSSNSNR